MNILLAPNSLIDPYPVYNQIRDTDPVFELEKNTWIISRYHDVCSGLKNHKLFSSARKMELCTPKTMDKHCKSDLFIASLDPPDYHKYRSVITPPFYKNLISNLESSMDASAREITTAITKRNKIEFFHDFSYPYVASTINMLFGIDEFQDCYDTHKWIQALEITTMPGIDNETIRNAQIIILKQKKIFEKIVEKYSAFKTDHFVSDLLFGKDGSEKLTVPQLVGVMELLYRGGYQTTVHLLAVAVLKLIHHPELLSQINDSPELLSGYIDEIVRLYSPVPTVIRHSTEDFELHSKTVNRGDLIWFSLAGANRDPDYFKNPDQIDLKRKLEHPNISFGFGPHACMGIQLAKLETASALKCLLPVIPRMTCPTEDKLSWYKTMVFRGMENLPITLRTK